MAISRISITKARAKKLVKIWDSHVQQGRTYKECKFAARCTLNEFFEQLRKKTEDW